MDGSSNECSTCPACGQRIDNRMPAKPHGKCQCMRSCEALNPLDRDPLSTSSRCRIYHDAGECQGAAVIMRIKENGEVIALCALCGA